MRIVGGSFRGAALHAPKGSATRPTSDRVRESIFNILSHSGFGPELEGARVLDLFSGTGALGLEALSRGARFCLFVEKNAVARGILQQNIEQLGVHGHSKVFRRDATALGHAGRNGDAAFVFLDPPYGQGLGEKALRALDEGQWLLPGAIAVLEERASSKISFPTSFEPIDQRKYGDTCVHFARYVDNSYGGARERETKTERRGA